MFSLENFETVEGIIQFSFDSRDFIYLFFSKILQFLKFYMLMTYRQAYKKDFVIFPTF